MTDQLFDMQTARVGDEFSKLMTGGYTSRIASAYDYLVIRAGRRDIVCHARQGDGFVTNTGDGKPVEFRFKRDERHATAYCLGHSEVIKARQQIADYNRRSNVYQFISRVPLTAYDDEFMTAVEALQKRVSGKP